MKKVFFILFIVHSSLQIAEAQQPTEEWVRTYNSIDGMFDHFIDMVTDRFGNIYVTGWNGTQSQGNNMITLKYNGNGVLQWSVEYNRSGISNDLSNGMAVDSTGNCYVVGYSGFNFGPYDGVLIKYNQSGDTLWTRKLVTSLDDDFSSVVVDLNNSVYVSGRSGDSAIVFKYDSMGIMQWRARDFQSQYLTLGGKLLLDRFNNLYIGSTKHIFNNPFSADFLVRKYTSNGTLIWATPYNGPSNVADWMTGFVIDNSGNSYSTGYTDINGRDILTVKLNSSGIVQWAKFYNGITNASDQGNGIICDTAGVNIFVTGYEFKTGVSRDYLTIKYNANGDTIWTRRYNGQGNYQDNAMGIALDKQLNVYVTGESTNINQDFDVATIKYSPDGNLQWIANWNSPGTGGDGGNKIIVDNQFNLYVGGGAAAPGPNYLDLLTIKYSQPVGITTINNEIPKSYNLSQNYPNPFNPTTNIKYQIKNSGNVKLSVFDISGREVATLVNEKQISGTYEVTFDAQNFASGIYLYELSTDEYTVTRKMVLIK
ncbi:MAG: SBBP repeat-containing protein [Ignavibacteria bacterium]